MNQNQKPKTTALDINVDQWRRDINTFAATTLQALDVIVAQLSNSCTILPKDDEWGDSNDRPTAAQMDERTTNEPKRDANNDERLSQLKFRLAERILKSS